MNWSKLTKREMAKGTAASSETSTGIYYEVRNNGDVYEDLGGSFNKIASTGSVEAGKSFVEKRTKPHVDEDFPDGFAW